jgi:hypothetical protein
MSSNRHNLETAQVVRSIGERLENGGFPTISPLPGAFFWAW